MLIRLMQAHPEHIDEGGILVFLDFEKSFDRCSWSYLHLALRELRFTQPFTSWVGMFYDESVGTKRQVLANGFLSRPYRVRRGTAQGCPLSPLLFLVIMEGFTRLVNNDDDLKGIEIIVQLVPPTGNAGGTSVFNATTSAPGLEPTLFIVRRKA